MQHIHTGSKAVFEILYKKAIKEEQEENNKNGRPPNNLKVFGDESWKKHGFKSLYGVTMLIEYYSGKVIDLLVKSNTVKLASIGDR